MVFLFRSSSWLSSTRWVAAALLTTGFTGHAQSPSCPAIPAHDATPAETAYGDGRYTDAETAYQQALAQNPANPEASAGLVRSLLHQGKVAQAATQANANLATNPHAGVALVALAEVQLRQGEPWAAGKTLDAAATANPCNARLHYVRSRVLRIDSMYASERKQLQTAYDMDPADPDIQHAFLSIVSPAHDIEGIHESLATMKDMEPEARLKAETTLKSMLPLLSENSQTCQVLPAAPSATLSLQPTFADVKHIDGYRLDSEFSKSKGKLILDTAASGLFISKTLADLNGYHQGPTDPPGTVRVDSVRVGPLEFRDCLVGVSDSAFAGKADGFIGGDMFAQWLVTLDFRLARLNLSPLPAQTALLPGDRLAAPELAGFAPVYRRRQYLLVPLAFGNNTRKLFILATGMRFSAMTPDAAHSLSKITVNFTNSEQTAQGGKVNFYREIFDMQVGNLPQIHQGHILEFDPTAVNRSAGFQIAGMLGLDVLQPLKLQLDYRDGLVKFEAPQEGSAPSTKETTIASGTSPASDSSATPACAGADNTPRSLDETIEAKVTGILDAGHLKPGKEIFVEVAYGYAYPGCRLDEHAILYGHVISASPAKNSGQSELELLFDHGDCAGKAKKELTLRLIGLIGPRDDSTRHMHEELPSEVGGVRNISSTVDNLVNANDEDLNPGGRLHTVQPGIVVRMPDVKLEPEGGPNCSAKITRANHSVQFGVGSELILTMLGVK